MPEQPHNDGFDPERSRIEFARERPRYERLASYVCGLISDHCGEGLIHTTEHRAKDVESFAKKSQKTNEDGGKRYPQPLQQITDLAGVRVIVFLRDSVDVVCGKIGQLFEVIEQEDVGERVYSKGKFGYQSKHLLIRLGPDRSGLVENQLIRDLVCEVQVRTLLQHAWAEMEHDIQYKGEVDIPLDLNKRFSALAGLLEIADREFASIQRESEALKAAVKEDAITDLTQQTLIQIQGSEGGASEAEDVLDARELIGKGLYKEAIDLYSTKLKAEPKSYTLFIGRARARFLSGDVRGAIADLDNADEISGDSRFTARLRGIIERGDDPRRALRQNDASQNYSAGRLSASQAMRQGDGVRAFEEYSRLESSGYNRAYSLLGKSMACALERDTQGAKDFLKSLELRPGTPMAVNLLILRCVLDVMDGQSPAANIDNLRSALREVPDYDLAISSVNELREGLCARAYPDRELIEGVFREISGRGYEAP